MQKEWQINDYLPDPNTGKDRWQIYHIFKGGMGVVYIVYDAEWREAFAVKTYQDKLQSAKAQEQFKKEANIWINLDRHENIAWARFVEKIQNRFYLFLEYIPGGDLSRWIGTKRLDLKQTLLFAIQFCYGMEHAIAKGVKAHRDIKPKNCLITANRTLKITDFGLANVLDTPDLEQGTEYLSNSSFNDLKTTFTGQAGGTLPYMAPEQFDDLKRVDVKADIYSFGIMLYEMICGQLSFTGNTYKELREKHQKASIPVLPPFPITQAAPLADIVKKCMTKQYWLRYSDFFQLRKELIGLYKIIFKQEAPLPIKAEKLNAIDLCNKGMSLANLGRYKEAINCYDQAIEIDSKFALAWYNKGDAFGNLGRYKETILCCDQAIKINPKFAYAWSNKGVAFFNMGLYEDAISCYNYAIEIEPNDAKTWYNKGNVLLNIRHYKEAIVCYNHAIEIDPKYSPAWCNKGVTQGKLARREEEIRCYEKALEIDPNNAKAWFNRGNYLVNIEKYEEAIACFNKTIEITPNLAYAWSNKAFSLVYLGYFHEALKCFQRAQQLGHDQATQGIELCQQYLQK